MSEPESITAELVGQLVSAAFPAWSGLPVSAVERQGWDNRTFRVGERLSARLPSADGYVEGFVREEETLERLREHVSFAIPRVIAMSPPTPTFPRPWSMREWLVGEFGIRRIRCRCAPDRALIGRFPDHWGLRHQARCRSTLHLTRQRVIPVTDGADGFSGRPMHHWCGCPDGRHRDRSAHHA